MTEAEIETILQGAKEKYPEARRRIISDNGPQAAKRDPPARTDRLEARA